MAADVEYRFLEEVSAGFRCYLCSNVARTPYQHGKCGTLFCFQCLQEYGMFTMPCKQCKAPRPQYFEDNRSEYGSMAVCADQYSMVAGWMV